MMLPKSYGRYPTGSPDPSKASVAEPMYALALSAHWLGEVSAARSNEMCGPLPPYSRAASGLFIVCPSPIMWPSSCTTLPRLPPEPSHQPRLISRVFGGGAYPRWLPHDSGSSRLSAMYWVPAATRSEVESTPSATPNRVKSAPSYRAKSAPSRARGSEPNSGRLEGLPGWRGRVAAPSYSTSLKRMHVCSLHILAASGNVSLRTSASEMSGSKA
mmetsp:Transcript_24439/g.56867  ORF Transcript_24439/g.56867 Transcript_24439/m.56867 type:complete len:215 (+) Transcript_24439:1000-1644(+)